MSRARNTRRGWTDVMRHGTDNGYTNGGCRCDLCRQAAAKARREREHRAGRAIPWNDYLFERKLLAA